MESLEDDYEGNFETRKGSCLYFNILAKTFLFGPLSDVSSDIIRKVTVGYVAGSSGPGPQKSKRPHIQSCTKKLSRIMMTVMLLPSLRT